MAKRVSPQAKQAAARLAVATDRPAVKADRVRAALDTLDGVERLDISRPFGKVTGDYIVNGVKVAYEQSRGRGKPSKLYDHAQNRIYRDGEREAEKAARAAAPPVRRREVDAAPPPAAAANPDPDNDDDEEDLPPMSVPAARDEDEPVAVVAGDDSDVNLTAWAERKVSYRWAPLRDAIEARFGRVVNDENEARDFLAEEGIGKGSGRKAVVGAGE